MSAPSDGTSSLQAMEPLILVAGTFDILHAGHYLLFHAAFHAAAQVEVWLSSDAMCSEKSRRCGQALQSFAQRSALVQAWLDAQTPASIAAFEGGTAPIPAAPGCAAAYGALAHPYSGRYSLHSLPDALGPAATEARYTAIVCSQETRPGCEAINSQRLAAGLAPLRLLTVPLLCKQDGHKLSSSDERARLQAQGSREGAPEG